MRPHLELLEVAALQYTPGQNRTQRLEAEIAALKKKNSQLEKKNSQLEKKVAKLEAAMQRAPGERTDSSGADGFGDTFDGFAN